MVTTIGKIRHLIVSHHQPLHKPSLDLTIRTQIPLIRHIVEVEEAEVSVISALLMLTLNPLSSKEVAEEDTGEAEEGSEEEVGEDMLIQQITHR